MRTATGMIGSEAYRVSIRTKRPKMRTDRMMGTIGILGEARLKRRRTMEDVYGG